MYHVYKKPYQRAPDLYTIYLCSREAVGIKADAAGRPSAARDDWVYWLIDYICIQDTLSSRALHGLVRASKGILHIKVLYKKPYRRKRGLVNLGRVRARIRARLDCGRSVCLLTRFFCE